VTSAGGESAPWDVVVVGAGPAGACAALGALRADPGLRVLLLDRADFPRDKSCGDGIAPHALDALRSVGAADAVAGWAPLRNLELTRGEARVAGPMAREVYVVPREVFDARLVGHAIRAGAVLERRRVRRVEVALDRVVLDGEVEGRVVVGADGVHSVLRPHLLGQLSGQSHEPRAIAIRGYAPTTEERRGKQVIRYGPRAQPAYAWAFDRGDGWCNVGYGELLPGRSSGAAPSRALLLEQLEELLPRSVPEGKDWKGHHLPLSGWRWQQPDGRVLLVGDAAALVNPMTGEGIYYAVATGILAGGAAARCIAAQEPQHAGAQHRKAVRGLLARHLKHTWAAARLARVPAVVDAGIRAAGRDRHCFDTLVELGLGDGRIGPRLAGGLVRELPRSFFPTRHDIKEPHADHVRP
jgi:geranylgeranyl reductase family protein